MMAKMKAETGMGMKMYKREAFFVVDVRPLDVIEWCFTYKIAQNWYGCFQK